MLLLLLLLLERKVRFGLLTSNAPDMSSTLNVEVWIDISVMYVCWINRYELEV